MVMPSCNIMQSLLSGCSAGLPARWATTGLSQMVVALSAYVVAPCVTLSCHALYDPQEEDSVPPRPPLPQSYEPNPPTVPPLPSRASIRPPSLHRPEDRKANSRNGTNSVSSLTRWPHWLTLPVAVSPRVIAWVKVFTFISTDISCLDEVDHIPLFTWCHCSFIIIFQLDDASLAYLFFSFELSCLVFLFCVSFWTSASSVLLFSVLGCNHIWVSLTAYACCLLFYLVATVVERSFSWTQFSTLPCL